jgi:hypothetical protein
MKRVFIFLSFLVLPVLISSCTKTLDAGIPQTQLSGQAVFSSSGSATSALLDIYAQIATNSVQPGCSTLGQSSDELVSYSNPPSAYYTNSLSAQSGSVLWGQFYTDIYGINKVVEGVRSSGIDSASKAQILGEAYFLRAWHYFYLVNLYGDVPYATSSAYAVNAVLPRTPASQVYANILSDLQLAQSLLTNTYPTVNNAPGGQRVRANQAAATAMLARVYLYRQDWADAAAQASAVISNTIYSLEPNLNNVFLTGSNEAIWQVMPSLQNQLTNGPLGLTFILTTPPSSNYNGYVALGDAVWNSFDAGDQRKVNWAGTYSDGTGTWHYAYKYKVDQNDAATTEYTVVLRLAEMYLIRAEALARQNQIAAAVQDINTLRQRAGAAPLAANMSLTGCLAAIAKERQSELFTEWGDRWLDLKRTGQADAVLSQIAVKNWQPLDTLYPIPQADLIADPKLIQNPGY